MNWLQKTSSSDMVRLERNVRRLEKLKAKVHELGNFVMSSQSGGHAYLSQLINDQLVRGTPLIHAKLSEALIGENNQKIALDAPMRFNQVMAEAETLIDREILKRKKELKKLEKPE